MYLKEFKIFRIISTETDVEVMTIGDAASWATGVTGV